MKKFHRALAFVLCLLLAGSCVFAEESLFTPEIIQEAAIFMEEAPAAEETIEKPVLPEAEPAADTTAEPLSGLTEAPDTEATAEPASSAEAVPEASAEISIEATTSPELPFAEPTDEATAGPTAELLPEPTVEAAPEAIVAPTVEAGSETAEAHPAMLVDIEELVLGVKEKYTPEVRFSDGKKHDVSISSENAKIAKVDKKGMITPLAVGETVITIESEFGETIELPLSVKKAPYNLKLDTKELRLGAGQNYQLELSVPEDCAGAIEWKNSKPKIVSVDENGLVTALSSGSAYVRAEAYNGKYASLTVRVYAAPESLHLAEEEIILGVGQPFTLGMKEELPEESYSFSSDNPEVLTINAKGEVSALAAGEAIITAESYNGLKDECRVIVKPAPEKIAFHEKEIILCSRDSYSLQPLLMGASEGIEVSFKSSTSRFRINGNTITASSTGTGTITATTYNGLTATVQVTSISAPKKVAFKDAEITLFMGTDAQPALDVDCSYTLTSSDPEIVSAKGQRITALKPGDAQVKATTFNKKSAVLNVHVPPLPDSLALRETTLALGCGDTYNLQPVIPDGQGSSFHYESSDPAVAAVDAAGRIEAVAPGSAVITVRTLNDLSAGCAVTVYEAPTAVQLSPSRVIRSMEQGAFALGISFGGENQGGRYTIESSNPEVATVSHDGMVTPVAPGETTITIETYNGLRADARIYLGEKPSFMAFAQDIFVALGDSIPVAPQFDKGCESYSLESTDSAIAAVSGDRLTGVSLGTTVLNAVSISGLTARCRVTVVAPPAGIELSHGEEKLVLSVSPTLQLTGRALPDGVGSIRYESSDPAIAAVDENGLVTAYAMGDCIITALTYDGKHSAECIIHVRGVLDGVKIGIDPGHQRKADGSGEAISPTSTRRKARTSHGTSGRATKIPEYVTNLVIGLRLREILEAHGAEVHMTRTHHDVNISNQERAKMMNELGVDLVLRIHCNSSSRSSVKGMSNYVRKTGVGKEESLRAAQLILDAMAAETGAVNQGVKESDEYTGLNWSTVPSTLMELGYMSNRAEDVLLNTPEYQDKLIIGMIRGICAYMDRAAPEVIIPDSLITE